MARIVRGALVQASWTGDKESMIQKHEAYAHEAAKAGAQVILFQELFYGPYFCQVQDAKYYSYTELIPDGPTTKRMQDLAKQTGWSSSRRCTRRTRRLGDLLQHRRRHRRRRQVPRQVPQDAHPARAGLLGEVLLPARQPGLSRLRDRGRQGRRLHLLRPALPGGRRALGLNGAEIVFIPSATSRGLSEYLWRIEQPSHAVANGYYVGTINRVGIESEYGDDDFYGQSYFIDPRGQFVGDVGSAHDEELIVRDLDMDKIAGGPQYVAVLPRPPTRRIRGPHATVERAIIRAGSAVWRRTAEPS